MRDQKNKTIPPQKQQIKSINYKPHLGINVHKAHPFSSIMQHNIANAMQFEILQEVKNFNHIFKN